jgi:hypothetical protein
MRARPDAIGGTRQHGDALAFDVARWRFAPSARRRGNVHGHRHRAQRTVVAGRQTGVPVAAIDAAYGA